MVCVLPSDPFATINAVASKYVGTPLANSVVTVGAMFDDGVAVSCVEVDDDAIEPF